MCRCRITFLRSSINISSKVSRPRREKMQISVASHFTPTPTHLSLVRLALKSTIVGNRWGGVEQRQPLLKSVFVLIRAECTCGTHPKAEPIRNIFLLFLCARCLSSPRSRFGETPRSNRVICYIGCRSVYFVFSSLHAADLSAQRLVK